MTKAELLRLVNREWQKLVGQVYSLPSEVIERPHLIGALSLREVLESISSRENVLIERLRDDFGSRSGESVGEDVPSNPKVKSDLLAFETPEAIQRNLEVTHSELVRAIERLPEKVFEADNPNLSEWLAAETFRQYAELREGLLNALATRNKE
jgi:hypothetical protein